MVKLTMIGWPNSLKCLGKGKLLGIPIPNGYLTLGFVSGHPRQGNFQQLYLGIVHQSDTGHC